MREITYYHQPIALALFDLESEMAKEFTYVTQTIYMVEGGCSTHFIDYFLTSCEEIYLGSRVLPQTCSEM